MNLQMVHSIENKVLNSVYMRFNNSLALQDENLEAFGEKEEKTRLLALEPLAEKIKVQILFLYQSLL